MAGNLLIYGEKLNSDDLKRIRSGNPERSGGISFFADPVIPKEGKLEGTAYVDLENKELCRPEFLAELKRSFDKLKIVGIADNTDDDQAADIALMGVSEIVTPDEYTERIAAYVAEPEEKDTDSKVGIKKSENQFDANSIIGNSPRMKEIKNIVEHLSDVDYPNAIFFGETGTGKDLLAKVLHYSGVRRDQNLIEVNCSAIPDELFESELFGHKKGAFTDAKNDKKGLFEYADNGTIFLDEIGNLSVSAQAKLLKILENKKLRPVGAVKEKDINVRVLAATNINLEEAVAKGAFREDLLFRLNLIAIHLPPLRHRKEDIPALARGSFDFYRSQYNKSNLKLTKGAIDSLFKHEWPGNVRELRNVIERAVLLATKDNVTSEQIEEAIRNGRVSVKERRSVTIEIPDQGVTLREIEKKVVAEILNMVGWNRSEASRMLGISRARLRRIMEENKLEKDRRSRKRN